MNKALAKMREQLVSNIFIHGKYEDERQDTMNSRTLSHFSEWQPGSEDLC